MTSTSQERMSWTSAGSDAAAQSTYASIRKALAGIELGRNIEIFLQGSYANTTNIRDDSDVDIVVMTHQTFQGATERLGAVAKARYDALPSATFRAPDLRREVTQALASYYGSARVHPRNKCIRVDRAPGYVDADVVPCLQYRWFRRPDSDIASDYVEGITIEPVQGNRIINFPKEHISNGKSKNTQCDGHYKETVRQVKRLRNRAVDEGRLEDGVAPGYLLECMVYNLAPQQFVADDSKRLSNVILALKFADKTDFWSCDAIHKLFRTDPGGFDTTTAQTIMDALWEAY
jgi:predicted nucleotidyltransferase